MKLFYVFLVSFLIGFGMGSGSVKSEPMRTIQLFKDGKVYAQAITEVKESRIVHLDGDNPGSYLAFPLYEGEE